MNKEGKIVAGTAAFIHTVYGTFGGEREYNKFIGEKYIEEFVTQTSDMINEEIEKEVQRRVIKETFKAINK